MPGVAPRVVVNDSMGPINGSESPTLYVQQVVLRTAVMPWAEDLSLSDAFRGPLFEIFNLLEIIQNYQDAERYLKMLIVTAIQYVFGLHSDK